MPRIQLLLRRTALPKRKPSPRWLPFPCAHSLPQPKAPLQSAFRWSYLWYASVLALGVTTGLGARHFAGPLNLPVPGTRADALILDSLSTDMDHLEIVQWLRSQACHRSTDGGGAGDGRKIATYKDWRELELDLGKEDEERQSMLGAMRGTRGMGVQRAFWNARAEEMVAVVWIGGGLSGWPGIAHGGAIATVFEEVMARMAGGPEGRVEPSHRPSSLSLTYAKPTYSLDFYILRASFKEPETSQSEPGPDREAEFTKSWPTWLRLSNDPAKQDVARQHPSRVIVGTLESVRGDLCVKAKGTFGFIP